MKKKSAVVADIILFINLAVYLLAYVYCIVSSIIGANTFSFGSNGGGKIYGIDAFLDTMGWLVIIGVFTGVIPAFFVYDIVFLIVKSVRKTLQPYHKIILVTILVLMITAAFITLYVA